MTPSVALVEVLHLLAMSPATEVSQAQQEAVISFTSVDLEAQAFLTTQVRVPAPQTT